MYAHIASIKSRLQAALPAWTVVDGTEAQDRSELPRADVRLIGASFEKSSGPGVTLQARYLVRLVVDSSAAQQPFVLLDGAVDTAIGRLHNWRPDGASARLALQGLREMEYAQGGLFGYELGFALTTTRQGCND